VLRIDDSLGSAHAVWVRPSMKKFESDNRRLFILSYSKHIAGNLNHQIISILSTLKVSNESFQKLQRRAVHCARAHSRTHTQTHRRFTCTPLVSHAPHTS
jgi:hypothetical protein